MIDLSAWLARLLDRNYRVVKRVPDDWRANKSGEAFFFYLRSFANDGDTTERWKLTEEQGLQSSELWGSPKLALQGLLQELGPLKELGGRPNSGLEQVTAANEVWWDEALRYIIHSTANFLNPGSSEGLTREINLILKHDKLLRRTFLIMEPTHETMLSALWPSDTTAANDRKPRWNSLKEVFRAKGIALPDYHDNGAIISLREPHLQLPFIGLGNTELYALMQHEPLYVDLTKRGSHNLNARERCPCQSGRSYRTCHARKLPRS
jgi:hypothetical protein